MTISNETSSITLTGDGANTTFAYNFLIPYQADGVTPAVGAFTTIASVVVALVLNTDFSITGIGQSAGGTVTYPLSGSPLPNGGTLTISRAAEYIQPYAFPNQAFRPEALENALDWMCMTLQQINSRLVVIEGVLEIEPAPFDFGELFDQLFSVMVEGEEVTLSFSPQVALDVSVTNGEYSLNNGEWTMAPGRAHGGDRVKPRHTTAATPSTLTTTVVEVGSVSGVFESITEAGSVQQSVGNDGTGVFPGGAIATTPANFAANLAGATAGQTLALGVGDYTTLMSALNGINKGTGAGVVIQGQTGVLCRNIALQSCVGLHFKYLTGSSATATPSGMTNCDHCSFNHLTISQGVLAVNRSTGIGVLTSTNCSVTACDIFQVGNGIIVAGGSVGAPRTACTDITIGGLGVGNRIQQFMGNAIFFQVGTRFYGGYNWVRNQDLEDGHGDFFQITEVDSPTAEYNYCDARSGLDNIQGIVFTERCNTLVVRGNCSFGAIGNGCQLSADTDVLVDDNFWQGTLDNSTGQTASGLVVRDACDNVTVTDNQYNFLNVYNGGGVNTNMHVGANTIIASAASKGDLTVLNVWLAAHPTVNHF